MRAERNSDCRSSRNCELAERRQTPCIFFSGDRRPPSSRRRPPLIAGRPFLVSSPTFCKRAPPPNRNPTNNNNKNGPPRLRPRRRLPRGGPPHPRRRRAPPAPRLCGPRRGRKAERRRPDQGRPRGEARVRAVRPQRAAGQGAQHHRRHAHPRGGGHAQVPVGQRRQGHRHVAPGEFLCSCFVFVAVAAASRRVVFSRSRAGSLRPPRPRRGRVSLTNSAPALVTHPVHPPPSIP